MSDKRIRTRIKRLSLVSRNMKTIAGIRRRAIHRMEKQLGRKLEFNELNAVIRAVRVDYSHTAGPTQISLGKITNEAIWSDILSVGAKMSDHTEWVRIMKELPRCGDTRILGSSGQIFIDEYAFEPTKTTD